MKTTTFCLLLVASACVFTTAQAQTGETHPRSAIATAPTVNLREASSETGRLMPRNIEWDYSIPLNKTYEQLNAKQLAAVRALYETIPDTDEPPFPLKGIKPIYNVVNKAQQRLQARGELIMSVTVGPDGKAIKVEDYGTNNRPEMTKFAADILLLTEYKPAVCAGHPCTMQFPFRVMLRGQASNYVQH
ncbi:MAG TPA: hypothetical protein VGO61_14425 [Steroidobacteraceae bacterium]|jgi:hypothetical protein|nr:hypothetical protein [Steroidobacteraceae bacterium]